MSPEPPRGAGRRSGGLLQPVLRESPQLRVHALARARTARRVAAVVVGIPLAALLLWGAWALFSLRDFGISVQTPLRADRAATRLLDSAESDVVLLVMRAADAEAPVVALLRADPSAPGSWLLGMPDAPLAKEGSVTTATVSGSLAGGRSALMKSVTSLTGLRIAHYVEVDVGALAEALGQTRQASDATETPSEEPSSSGRVQVSLERFVVCSITYAGKGSGISATLATPSLARKLGGHVASDLGSAELSAALTRLGQDAATAKLDLAIAPVESLDRRWVVSRTATRQLAERMLAGKPFGQVDAAVQRIAPAGVSVTVHNGAGREGVAAEAARILTREGYRVGPVGNANQFVYDRTLVVYQKKRPAAEAVASDLGRGSIVASRGMYSFGTDVLVIVGKDWPVTP